MSRKPPPQIEKGDTTIDRLKFNSFMRSMQVLESIMAGPGIEISYHQNGIIIQMSELGRKAIFSAARGSIFASLKDYYFEGEIARGWMGWLHSQPEGHPDNLIDPGEYEVIKVDTYPRSNADIRWCIPFPRVLDTTDPTAMKIVEVKSRTVWDPVSEKPKLELYCAFPLIETGYQTARGYADFVMPSKPVITSRIPGQDQEIGL